MRPPTKCADMRGVLAPLKATTPWVRPTYRARPRRRSSILGPRFRKWSDQPCREQKSNSLNIGGRLGKVYKDGLAPVRGAPRPCRAGAAARRDAPLPISKTAATVRALWVTNWGYTRGARHRSDLGAGGVGQVCVRLVSVQGVPWQTPLLGRLDLRIQVGALAQTPMDPAPMVPGQRAQQVDDP